MAAYIKFDGVKGEALDKDHKNWSDLASFGQGITQPGCGGTGASRRRGDVILDDITCSKELDKASPRLPRPYARAKSSPRSKSI